MQRTDLQTLLVSLALLVCSACTRHDAAKPGQGAAKAPLPLASLAEYRRCERDDQCTWVTNGCCDCANGGDDIAVAADKKAAFRALFSCNDTPCTDVAVTPACGTGTAACEAGLCVFHEAGARP
jgi:hypothetical protein